MSAADLESVREAERAVRDAARHAALRAARTAALARRAAAAHAAATEDFLVCACGSERFGLPLAAVARVLAMRPCAPVPGAARAILGLVALSGRIVSVLDLAGALDRAGGGLGEGSHLVVLRGAAMPIALAVNRALGVARLAADPDDAGGFGGDAVSRYAPAESGPSGLGDFVVIDVPRLLRRTLP